MCPIGTLAVLILGMNVAVLAASASTSFHNDHPASGENGSTNLTELAEGWQISAADQASGDDAVVSSQAFDTSRWHPVRHMPATVLEILQEDGVYKDLYYGTNLATPGELWKKQWWYRTKFTAPPGREVYSLIFKGINYRADVWLNGHKIADKAQVVGMYNSFEFDISKQIRPGQENVLALKITPEQPIPKIIPAADMKDVRVEGSVELGDTWLDWLNWKYIGVHNPETGFGFSFVPDRNVGVWKRVYLSATGAVSIRNAYVATDLPLPATAPASLTVFCDLNNRTSKVVSGVLSGEIWRLGKPTIRFEQPVSLFRNEAKEVARSLGRNSTQLFLHLAANDSFRGPTRERTGRFWRL